MHDEAERGGSPSDTARSMWRSRVVVAAGMLAVIVAFYLLREHWSHAAGAWPYALLLACPLMHVFMHGRGGAHGHGQRPGRS